ncbi:MAG TPA: alkaline phosphatase family protein [Terriglobales bacterium]
MTASLAVLMAGCGATHLDQVNPPLAPPTVTIAASPATIMAGKASTLTVVARNATTVTITGSDGTSYKMAATGGTQSVTPAATATYTATATGGGGTASAKTVVTVTPSPTAPTVKISASPASINAGESSTLTVEATNATAVTISGSDGSSYDLAAAGGTQAVSPKTTTTYTATATGAGGKITATATVTVAALVPTVTITANPTTIVAGSASTLTVAATNASTVSISGSDGSTYTLAPAGGTQSVTPAGTTTYTVTAANGGESATAAATITVTPPVTPPTVTIAANPPTITAGSNSTLTVVAGNATTVTIAGSDGTTYQMTATGGTQVVAPLGTTTYTVTATSGTLTATAAATVTVVPAPPPPVPTVTITASPTAITAGASSTLTVVATNATNVSIASTDGEVLAPLQPTGGTVTVSPASTSTYTVTATGAGGTASANVIVTVTQPVVPTVTINANPTSIVDGSSSLLTVTATNATTVTVAGSDGSSYTLSPTGGTQSVSPKSTSTYTATADGGAGTTPATATATVTVTEPGNVNAINHVIFMMQENHSFDNYFGMLNPYRQSKGYNIGDDGVAYSVDGIEDKLNGQPYDSVGKAGRIITNNDKQHVAHTLYPFKSTCVDDMSSAWTESYGDVSLGNFTTTRAIAMNGFVSNADGFATSCAASGKCAGSFTDLAGDRAMGVYDQGFLNYYYYMASQFALSDRWFSPMSSKSIPNRVATFTGGTTQGLTNDPSSDDHLQQLTMNNIFQELDSKKVSWKLYYTVNNGLCIDPTDCNKSGSALFPATSFSYLTYSYQYVNGQKPCTGKTVPSSAVGDPTNSFCIDPNHIAPISQYFTDLTNGTLPSFAFIEAGYGNNDEHPGSGQSVLAGQAQVAKIVNALMGSSSWKDSVFFLSYDEGGGPYDHVPPVPGHTNDFTTKTAAANYPVDVSTISVDADQYKPCVPPPDANGNPTPTFHCDLKAGQPGSNSNDAAAVSGFAAQEGFRVPNMVVSPFVKKHYVSHVPMDHTAIIKFVENRFIGPSASLTPHDAAEPDLLDFFDFNNTPWATPPTPPAPAAVGSSCQPAAFH